MIRFRVPIFVLLLLLASREGLASQEFTFAAVGDLGANNRTRAVLKGMSRSSADFLLFLGDLSYNEIRPETAWCSYVRSHLDKKIPVELLSGNHEEKGEDGSIDEFVKGFPDKLGSIGVYGREYYFDFPGQEPIARFIQISPNLDFPDGKLSYEPGSVHFDWLNLAIEGAHKAGIEWVLVSMHKNCLSLGEKGCEIGPGLLNYLVEKKVDVVLQGHDHNFQRSWPLATGPSCREILPGAFNEACIAGIDRHKFRKGVGTTVLILGTGGRKAYPLHPHDPERGYFAAPAEPNEDQATYGFGFFTISKEKLSFKFDRTGGKASGQEDWFELDKEVPANA